MAAIKVENLSKSYLVGHNSVQGEKYTALRDVVSRNARNLVRKTRDMITGRQIVQGDEVEEFWALRDINFEIQQGDRVGIIGHNGAGKSTLLKILSRITEPTRGRVTIHGRVASLLEVGTGFHPELTGRENIFLNGAILGMGRKEIQRKFDEIVDFAEVEKFLDTPVKRYSSGMYVRLAFAVAAHLEPEILVVDEVLAVGDAQFQKKCLGKMEDIGQEGRTVLFVSHNMAAIRGLCDRCVVLSHGVISHDGAVNEGLSTYFRVEEDILFTRDWDYSVAPRNNNARVISVRLVDSENSTLKLITTSTVIGVRIAYEVLRDNVRVGFSLIIYDEENVCVLSSMNNRVIENNSLRLGYYDSYCYVPKNLLNNGRFYISINMFAEGFSDCVLLDRALFFEVHDSDEIRGDYFGRIGGFIRPDLKWSTVKV